MSGAGTFDAQDKSVKAAGTFTHKSPNGNVLDTGVWLASEVVSFDSYGAAREALPNKGLAFGPGPLALKRPAVPPAPRRLAVRRFCASGFCQREACQEAQFCK